MHDEISINAWNNIVPYKNTNNIFRLCNEMMLLHLCSHFFSHSHVGVTLRMLCDINEMVKKYNATLQWDVLRDICSTPEIKNQVTMALTYTVIYFDTAIPNDFINNTILLTNCNKDLLYLIKGIPIKNQKKYSIFIKRLNYLNNTKEKIIYIYRTLFPEKAFLHQQYHNSKQIFTINLYIKHWKYYLFKIK